jgi:hypothetical protein
MATDSCHPDDGAVFLRNVVFTRATRRIVEYGILHGHRRENLKSYSVDPATVPVASSVTERGHFLSNPQPVSSVTTVLIAEKSESLTTRRA